ncbi:hypothetical protein BDZ89DRAFT_1117992 [Hymenopellis radicata]|nr:hypothetical protein BDZ89DRAFT_1117992 [Hymenopellis radicata]
MLLEPTRTSGQVLKRALAPEASAELAPFAGGDLGFELSVTVNAEAAFSFSPDGATRYVAKSRATYSKDAKANGIQYVNGAHSREAPGGPLYIVTERDKCRTWGTAAVSHPEDKQEALRRALWPTCPIDSPRTLPSR